MSMQKVMVTGWIDQEKVLETVRKTGRLAELWPFPHHPENHAFNYTYYDQFYQPPASRFTVNPETYYSVEPTYVDPNYDDYDNEFFSTYNYNVPGYNGQDNEYYQEAPATTVFSERTSAMFSDENAHGCSIM
ncbi:OLC1v1021325C1 [Oldenlandia corymbosa var. corymbosa]|nr:OLC1v1021325C1 [Oldenlandia corymbosa var. corymbosa]